MLKYRLLTALVIIPLVVLAIWKLPPLAFAIVMAVVVALAAWEWSRLIGFSDLLMRLAYVGFILLGIIGAVWFAEIPLLIVGCLALLWCTVAVITYQITGNACGLQKPFYRTALGFFILVPCWTGLLALQFSHQLGPIWVLYTLVIISFADTGAYFVGKACGKHKLIAKVSPNKTWEGLAGGLLIAMLAAALLSFLLPIDTQQRVYLFLLAIVTLLFSVLGDLAMSLLKRLSGVKDSGKILPGHGGILDRVDSVMAGIIVFALGAIILGL